MHIKATVTCFLLALLALSSDTSEYGRRNETKSPFAFFDLNSSLEKRRPRNITDLLDTLLLGYDHRLRPDMGGDPVEVLIDLDVRSMGPISEIDMTYSMDCYFRQNWKDSRLAYDPQMYEGKPKNLALSMSMLDKIWKPDTYFYNGKNAYIHTITNPNKFVRIASDGMVLYSSRLTVKASCSMRLERFPMDTQRCPLEVGSFGYTNKDVVYTWNPERKVVIASDMKMSQFDLISTPTGNETGDLKKGGSYSKLIVSFHFKRLMGSFMIEVYAPGILLVVLSWVSFWINREATADRISLGIMTILTMTFLGLETRNDLPKVTYMTALDYFVAITFAFIFATIVQFAIVHFYTKVGSGEYYIPPIEILEDIKAFHRARQAEKSGYTSVNGKCDSDADDDDGDDAVTNDDINVDNNDERYDNYITRHFNEGNMCNAVVVDDANTVLCTTFLNSQPVEMFHLTGHNSNQLAQSSGCERNPTPPGASTLTETMCHARQYSSSAPPPMSINTGAIIVPLDEEESEIKSPSLPTNRYSPTASTSGNGRHASPPHHLLNYRPTAVDCISIIGQHNTPTGGAIDTSIPMKSPHNCIPPPGVHDEHIHRQYPPSASPFCPIHGQMMKSRSSELLRRYTSTSPFLGNFEDTIEVQDANIDTLCTMIPQDIASSTLKRSMNDRHSKTIDDTHTRRRKNYAKSTAAAADHDKANNGKKSDKKKCTRKIIRSEGNPSIDSIPFRLNSVSNIDKFSRVLFPISFAIINYFYWHTFMVEEEDRDSRI